MDRFLQGLGTLMVLGLAVLIMLFFWQCAGPTGVLQDVISLRCQILYDVDRKCNITRTVSMDGPQVVVERLLDGIGINTANGWCRPPSPPPNTPASAVTFVKVFPRGNTAWALTRVAECRRRFGIFRFTYVLREVFLQEPLAEARERTGPSAEPMPQSEAVMKEWDSPQTQARQVAGAAGDLVADPFLAGTRMNLTVRMPGKIKEVRGMAVDPTSTYATYSGTFGRLAGIELTVVSKAANYWGIAFTMFLTVAGFGYWYLFCPPPKRRPARPRRSTP